MRIRSPLLVIGLALATTAFLVTPSAYADDPLGLCSPSGLNGYGQQYSTRSAFNGLYGRMITYDPVLSDYTTQFSLSHVYGDQTGNYDGGAFLEDGWAKGQGNPTRNYTHYYRAWGDVYGYHQYDDTNYPDPSSTRLYELLKQGYNATTGKYIWVFYYATLANTQGPPVEIKYLNTIAPAMGGEIAPKGVGGIGMSSHGVAPIQLQNTIGEWWDWTLTYAQYHAPTHGCASSPYTFTALTKWTEYRATGVS